MGGWHQIANATTMIAFSICLFIAPQMYVTSRLSATEFDASHALKLSSAGLRVPHGH